MMMMTYILIQIINLENENLLTKNSYNNKFY